MYRQIINGCIFGTLILLAFYLFSGISFGQEHSGKPSESGDLDEILQGVDDPQQADQDQEMLDDVLQGFDEEQDQSDREDELDEVLEGFEEGKKKSIKTTKKEIERGPPYIDFSGYVTLGAAYNFSHNAPPYGETDHRGLSRLRTKMNLDLDIAFSKQWKSRISGDAFYDFAYEINGRDEYTPEVLDAYEREAELGEAYLQGSLLPSLDIKTGRQIVVWGKADNMRVVDVLNPLDNREPGMVDIEDIRLPVTMTKLDYYLGKWNLSGIAVHEIRFNKNPVFGSDFFPYNRRPPMERKPSSKLENTEVGFALNGIFSGWDISLYGARFFNDQWHLEMVAPFIFEQRHSRLNMCGMAANVVLGNWLLKSEAAYTDGFKFLSTGGDRKSRFDTLLGVEYSGFRDTTLSLEVVNRHINEFDPIMELPPDSAQEDEFQAAFMYSGNFFHDTFHVIFLASMYDVTGDDGSFERFSMEYDFTDSFSVVLGVVGYQSGDHPLMRNIGDNDRTFLEGKYHF
jgi:hypothetical protein